MGSTWYIFAHPAFFNAKLLCTLPRSAALARLNSTPMTVCLELSSTVLCVCHRKPPKARLAPPKLPEPQVHLVYIAPLPACCVGRICATMRKFGPLKLTVLVGDSRCRVPVQKQWDELDSPQHVLAGSHKEDGCWGWLVKFLHSSLLPIGPSLGKSSGSKVLKNTSSSLMSLHDSSGPWV